MKQAVVALCLVWTCAAPAPAQKPDAAQRSETIAWLTRLQKSSGGFGANDKSATFASLPATLSAARAIRYFGGSAPRANAMLQFLRSCWNEEQGAFAPTPGGKPDVRTTALALMGLADLNAAAHNQDMIKRGMAYLGEHVKDYEDVRIAAAAYESNHLSIPQIKKWLEILHALPASTKPEDARDIGGVTVALLRLGDKPKDSEAILKTLRAGQRPEGAWGKAGSPPDLDSTYRIMRAFHMLRAAPNNPDQLRKFIASCRQPDGSYAVAPGQQGSISGTYYAGIISFWLTKLEESAKQR
jgi:prenyltransferase beta subunit